MKLSDAQRRTLVIATKRRRQGTVSRRPKFAKAAFDDVRAKLRDAAKAVEIAEASLDMPEDEQGSGLILDYIHDVVVAANAATEAWQDEHERCFGDGS